MRHRCVICNEAIRSTQMIVRVDVAAVHHGPDDNPNDCATWSEADCSAVVCALHLECVQRHLARGHAVGVDDVTGSLPLEGIEDAHIHRGRKVSRESLSAGPKPRDTIRIYDTKTGVRLKPVDGSPGAVPRNEGLGHSLKVIPGESED